MVYFFRNFKVGECKQKSIEMPMVEHEIIICHCNGLLTKTKQKIKLNDLIENLKSAFNLLFKR